MSQILEFKVYYKRVEIIQAIYYHDSFNHHQILPVKKLQSSSVHPTKIIVFTHFPEKQVENIELKRGRIFSQQSYLFPFQEFQYYDQHQKMPFLLSRKWTLPEKKSPQKAVNQISWKQPNKSPSFWSIPENDKETDEEIDDDSNKMSSTLKTLNLLTNNLLEEGDLDKKIQQNYYRVNFIDSQSPFLPKVKSISKAQKLLISKPEFAYFKQQNSVQGVYQSLLNEMERKEQSYFHKLNISSKVQIKTRKNVFQINHRQKSQSCSVSFKIDSLSNASKKLISLIETTPTENKSVSLARPRSRPKTKSNSKWKLKDFLDPIIVCSQTGEESMLKILERQRFLKKMKGIQKSCQEIEHDNSNSKYLQIFERFNGAVQTKLIKKQRKLDKVKWVFKK